MKYLRPYEGTFGSFVQFFFLLTAFLIQATYWSNLFLPWGGKATSCGYTIIQFHRLMKLILLQLEQNGSVSFSHPHTLSLALTRPPFASFMLPCV